MLRKKAGDQLRVLSLLTAAAAGLTMAVQGALNAVLGKTVGLLLATFLVHIIGTMFVLALLVFGVGDARWDMLMRAPWYTYLGGLLGVAIVYAVVVAISQIGVAAATTAIIVGQVSTAAIIDHFGLFGLEAMPFQMGKIWGIVLMAVAAWLLLRT